MEVNMENNYIKNYINEKGNLSKKSFKDMILIISFIGIPTGFLGANKSTTIPIISVCIISLIIWGILILKNKFKNQHILYVGVCFLTISVIFLIASYKIFSLGKKIQPIEILIVLSIYMLLIMIYTIFLIKNISKKSVGEKKNNKVYIFSASILGMAVGKSIFGNVTNNQAIAIVGSLLLLLALIFGFGTKMIVIYYLAKKHNLFE
jgi:hypothetical protein